MPAWRDTITSAPAAQDYILFRRYPNDTPPLYGRWEPSSGGIYCGVEDSYWIPYDLCTRWCYPTFIPPYPGEGTPTGWRDPYYFPPADQQSCWVRRYLGDTGSFAAVWQASSLLFRAWIRQEYTIDIEWYFVWRWKPM